MSIRYMVSRPDGSRTKMITFAQARDTVHDQAKRYAADKDRRMRLKLRSEDEWGVWRSSLTQTMERWESILKANDPGEVLGLDIEAYPYTIATRIILDEPPTAQTEGNDDIDKIFTWLIHNENGRNGGICSRRPISGSSTWSQHSPWPAPDPGSNAVDWFAMPDTMNQLYDQAHRLAAAATKDPQEVPVGLILVGSQKWTPGGGFDPSGAEYHRHLHIQGRRTRTGSPQSRC